MSLPYRLYRLARWRLLHHLGLMQGAEFRTHAEARRELEDYLSGRSASRRRVHRAPCESVGRRPHPLEYEYRLLGAPINADAHTVRRCWRRQVIATHPDRCAGDPEAARRASDRLRRINDAYARIDRQTQP